MAVSGDPTGDPGNEASSDGLDMLVEAVELVLPVSDVPSFLCDTKSSRDGRVDVVGLP